MKIRTLLLTGSLAVLGACSESKYDMDRLVPQEYHKILYVNNSGKQELTLFDTDEDNHYTLSVIKTGSDPNLTAGADIRVLTRAELEAEYCEPENINYKIIDAGSYVLAANRVDFSVADRYKLVDISLKPQLVKESMQTDPTAVWVLPLQVSSETDSVNASKSQLFLQIMDVIMPTLGFASSDVVMKEYTYGAVSAITENIDLRLDTENKWDIDWELAPDPDYIAEYNKENGTSFKVLPEGSYTLPETMSLTSGTTTTRLPVTISAEQLEPGDYMLPIRITNISVFEVSATNGVYPLAIRIMGPQLSRNGWTAEANTEELGGEGPVNGRAGCVLDDNVSTFWHSQWQGGSHALPHVLIIDAQEEFTFTQFAMKQRSDSFTDTGTGNFYVSTDKENWTMVGSFVMPRSFATQVFGITPARGRYIKIEILQSYRDLNCSLSEVYVYGLK